MSPQALNSPPEVFLANCEKRVAKRPHATITYSVPHPHQRHGPRRTGDMGRVSHDVADFADVRPDVHWRTVRLAPAVAHLRRRAQRSLYLAHDGSPGTPRGESD